MRPIEQLNQLNTTIQEYVEETNDQNLDHVFLRCITKGEDHEFKLVKKTFWNKVVIFFSSDKTKQQYNIVNNVAEIRKLFGKVGVEEGVKLETLETRLNGLINHVLTQDPFKGVAPLNFVATFIQQKGKQDAEVAKIAQKQAEEQRKVQEEAAKQKAQQEEQQRIAKEKEAQQRAQQEEVQRKAQQKAAEQKALQEQLERANQEVQQLIQQFNQPLKPVIDAHQSLYKEVLGVELDSSKKLIPQIMEKVAELNAKLLALQSKPNYLVFSKPTQYGTAGTPQANVLASLRLDLRKQVESLAKHKDDPAAFAKELEKSTQLFTNINHIFIARGADKKHPEYETAKRMEAFFIANQFIQNLNTISNARKLLDNTAFLVEFQAEVNNFPTCSEAEFDKNFRVLARGANNALSQYSETSSAPERKLLAGFVAFASELLGIDFNA